VHAYPSRRGKVADIRLRKAYVPRSRPLIALLRLRRGHARGDPASSLVGLGQAGARGAIRSARSRRSRL